MTVSKQERFAKQIAQLRDEIEQYRGRRRVVSDSSSSSLAMETYRRNGDDDGAALSVLLGSLLGALGKGTFTTSDANAVVDAITYSLGAARPKNGARR